MVVYLSGSTTSGGTIGPNSMQVISAERFDAWINEAKGKRGWIRGDRLYRCEVDSGHIEIVNKKNWPKVMADYEIRFPERVAKFKLLED